jgi:3-oxoacyl-[acyl-carrier-protein] synthase-3
LIDLEPRFVVRRVLFGTRGSEGQVLEHTGEYLFMNGRAVFDFSMTAVPPQIQQVVQEAGFAFDDIDLFLLHQGSKFIVDQMTRRLKLPAERVPSNLAEVGNTVSSSIPLLLEQYIGAEEVKTVVASGFGVGLSWASAVMERVS